MRKLLLTFLLGLACASVMAQSLADALAARNEALNALRSFNPATVLKDFSENPNEKSLHPGEGAENLKAMGLNALGANQTAKEIYQQGKLRESGLRVRPNPESPEMRYAESLLENPESVLDGACYQVKGNCKTQSVTKTCEDSLLFKFFSCKETINVKLFPSTQVIYRFLPHQYGFLTFNLTACTPGDWTCQSRNTVTLKEPCEALLVQVIRAGQSILVVKQPTCSDLTVTVQIPNLIASTLPLQVTVTEWMSEDSVAKSPCDSQLNAQCNLDNATSCLEPNAVKQIDGVKSDK